VEKIIKRPVAMNQIYNQMPLALKEKRFASAISEEELGLESECSSIDTSRAITF